MERRRDHRDRRSRVLNTLAMFAVPLFVVFLGWLVYANQPVIHYDSATREPIACKSKDTGWKKAPITHPACQAAQHGRHHTVWVAPR